jgi:ABC-2 type transport system permease protein
MKQFFTFVRKEFYHVFRDRKTLLMLFGLPIAQIILFGFALTNEIKDSKIVICDYAKDEASQRIITKIEANSSFLIEKNLLSQREIEAAFRKGTVKLVVVFPGQFKNDLMRQNKAQIQVIADASDPNTATTLTNYITNIAADYQKELGQTGTMPYQNHTRNPNVV